MDIGLKMSLRDKTGKPYMGIGLVWLLNRVGKFNSLNFAAKDMRMSYSKAHKLIRQLEAATDKKMVIRTKGGNTRGGSRLTGDAVKLIRNYELFHNKTRAYAETACKRYLSEFIIKKGKAEK